MFKLISVSKRRTRSFQLDVYVADNHGVFS